MGRRKTEDPKPLEDVQALEVENDELDNDEALELEAAALEEEAPAAPKPRRSPERSKELRPRPRKRKTPSAETQTAVAPENADDAIVPSPLNISTALYGAKPARSRRAPAKRKQPEAEASPATVESSAPVATPSAPATSAAVSSEAASIPLATAVPTPLEPAPMRAPATIAEPIPGDDLSMARASIEKSMDSMVQGWGSVKQISSTICNDLERVTKLLTEQTALHAPVAKPSPLNRWAIAASVVAVVLSLLSLSLSQTARQDIASREVPARFSHNPDLPLEPLMPRKETPRADPLGLLTPVTHPAPVVAKKTTPRRERPVPAASTSSTYLAHVPRTTYRPINARRMRATNVEMVLRRPVLLAKAEREHHSHFRRQTRKSVKALR